MTGEELPPEKEAATLRAVLDLVPRRFTYKTTREAIMTQIENLDLNSSPGVPWQKLGKDNRALIDVMGVDAICDFVKCRLDLIESLKEEEIRLLRAEDFVALGLCDPIRVFVKNEVHSSKKKETNRWRLIQSVSVMDQLIDRVLCAGLNNYEIEMYESLPVCPGMSRNEDGAAVLRRKFEKQSDPCGTDVSGYDMHTKWQMLNFDANRRAALYSLRGYTLFHARALMLASAVLVMPSGDVLSQRRIGLMKSGYYGTSSTNSWTRVLLYCCVVLKLDEITAANILNGVLTMGDDCIESVPSGFDLVGGYARYGFKIKDIVAYESGSLEFCALRFYRDGRVEPTRPYKLLSAFLNTWPSPQDFNERLNQFVMVEMKNSPCLGEALAVIAQCLVV